MVSTVARFSSSFSHIYFLVVFHSRKAMALFKLAEKDARDSLLGGEDNFAYVVLDTPQLRRSAFTIFRSNSVSSFSLLSPSPSPDAGKLLRLW